MLLLKPINIWILSELPWRPVGPLIVTKQTPSSLTLEWQPPLTDGGSPISGYIVEMCEADGNWRRVGYTSGRETNFTVAGLTEGDHYFFKITAENALGLSRPLQSDAIVPSRPAGRHTLFRILLLRQISIQYFVFYFGQ